MSDPGPKQGGFGKNQLTIRQCGQITSINELILLMNKDEYEEALAFFLHKNAYKHIHVEKTRKLLFEISECCGTLYPDGISITKSK